jgi:hypothetical protein
MVETPLSDVRRPTDRRTADIGPPAGVPERRKTKFGRRVTDAQKMACPFCADSESAVVRSEGRLVWDRIKRRRECAGCGRRFPTKEEIDWDALLKELHGDQEFQSGITTLLMEYPDDQQLRNAIRRHLADAARRGVAQRGSEN